MLTVIQGHSGMVMANTDLAPALLDSAQAIYFAAERAATLTRQLLLFSRKNVMQPKALDLRNVVGDLSKMLKRLLGETVALQFNPPAELPLVAADAGMLEQVIVNLAVNARDAMPKGGTLTIRTTPVTLNEAFVQMHPQARPGAFVCLEVNDTGCGMDMATMARIFEPFFTTKEVGKGTGLGLATVYGIVKQHEGWVEVSSEVGKGTTHVYLPASDEPAPAQRPGRPKRPPWGRPRPSLVEEDEISCATYATILHDCGYRTLVASLAEALQAWERQAAQAWWSPTRSCRAACPAWSSGKAVSSSPSLN